MTRRVPPRPPTKFADAYQRSLRNEPPADTNEAIGRAIGRVGTIVIVAWLAGRAFRKGRS